MKISLNNKHALWFLNCKKWPYSLFLVLHTDRLLLKSRFVIGSLALLFVFWFVTSINSLSSTKRKYIGISLLRCISSNHVFNSSFFQFSTIFYHVKVVDDCSILIIGDLTELQVRCVMSFQPGKLNIVWSWVLIFKHRSYFYLVYP